MSAPVSLPRLQEIASREGKEPNIGEGVAMAQMLLVLSGDEGLRNAVVAAAHAETETARLRRLIDVGHLELTDYELDGLVSLVRDMRAGWVKDHQKEGLRALARHLEARQR